MIIIGIRLAEVEYFVTGIDSFWIGENTFSKQGLTLFKRKVSLVSYSTRSAIQEYRNWYCVVFSHLHSQLIFRIGGCELARQRRKAQFKPISE